MDRSYRLGHLHGDRWVAYSHPATFELDGRILAGVPDSDPRVLASLMGVLQEPLRLLYVLHTPRGEAAAGRYESPDLSMEEARDFMSRFAEFMSSDGRFDLWVHSMTDNATLVWDRHDLDACATDVMRAFAWRSSPLRPEDIQ
jgi:hypothetical protein